MILRRLADAQYHLQTRRPRRTQLGRDQRVALVMILPPFAMAEQDQRGSASRSIGAEISPVCAPFGSG